MCENSKPGKSRELSKMPSEAPSPLVTVWTALSLFAHITSLPAVTVTICGMKHSFVSSQPGTEDPGALFTMVGSANAPIPAVATAGMMAAAASSASRSRIVTLPYQVL